MRLDVEARSVNGRFLEVKLRQPFGTTLEPVLRAAVEAHVGRGRVDVSIHLRRDAASSDELDPLAGLGLDAGKVAVVVAAAVKARRIAADAGLELSVPTSLELLRFCGSIKPGDRSDEAPQTPAFLEDLVREAMTALAEFRQREGTALCSTLHELVSQLASRTQTLTEMLPPEAERVEARVAARLAELINRGGAPQLDPSRVAQEVAVVLARGDVAEELARIDSHLDQMRSTLDAPAAVGQGKTLDFLTQELHREFTTMGSKLTSHEGSRVVIDAKAIIERIREQVQNVE